MLKIDPKRIMRHIEALAQCNDTPGNGITRFSYGTADREARAWLAGMAEELGLPMAVDSIGNIRIHYAGSEPELAPLLVGSHIDTVRHGGKYDGVVGVVGALEVLAAMRDAGHTPRRSVELVVFAEEEGSNFGTTMVGSKYLIGKLDYDGLEKLTAEDGRSAIALAEGLGLHPERGAAHVLRAGEIHGMLELHIEQGVVLDREGLKLGVVQVIAGMTTLEMAVHGVSNHAGSTPMPLRNDPMPAAAELILEIEAIAAERAAETAVATVGSIHCTPNAANVIPDTVRFTVDVRDITADGIDWVVQEILAAAARIGEKRGVRIEHGVIGASKPIALAPRIIEEIERAAGRCTDAWRPMNSGAVHDSAMMSLITDVGMIFIPSVQGKSHNPEEYTAAEDIALGCQALLETAAALSA